MNVYGGRFAQKSVHRGKIKIFAPIVDRGAAENHLGDMFRPDKVGHTIGNASAFQANHLSAEAFRETQIGLERVLIGCFHAEFAVHVNDVKFGIHAARHAWAAWMPNFTSFTGTANSAR